MYIRTLVTTKNIVKKTNTFAQNYSASQNNPNRIWKKSGVEKKAMLSHAILTQTIKGSNVLQCKDAQDHIIYSRIKWAGKMYE